MPFVKDTIEKIKGWLPWVDHEVQLTPEQLGITSSTLTNPQTRVELPVDFPPLLVVTDTQKLLEVVEKELREKYHTTLKEVGHINIAYPHKHPLKYPKHENAADQYARNAWYALEGATRGTAEWVLGSALTELVRLNRSEDQSSVHALAGKQEYVVYNPAQEKPEMQFGKPGNDNKKEFFIVLDSAYEQGTTFANLINFIRANGGIVLAGAVPFPDAGTLQQQDTGKEENMREKAALRPEFNDASRNTGRLPELALAFAESAEKSGQKITPQQALDMFEERLQKVGNSVFALTDGEAVRLIETMQGGFYDKISFPTILEQLDKEAAKIPAPVLKPVPALA